MESAFYQIQYVIMPKKGYNYPFKEKTPFSRIIKLVWQNYYITLDEIYQAIYAKTYKKLMLVILLLVYPFIFQNPLNVLYLLCIIKWK